MKKNIFKKMAIPLITLIISIFLTTFILNIIIRNIELYDIFFNPKLLIENYNIKQIINILQNYKDSIKITFFLWILLNALIVYQIIKNVNIQKMLGIKSTKEQKDISQKDEKGSARFLTKEEMKKNLPNWIYNKDSYIKEHKGGVVFGMEKIGETKERIYAENDDKHTLIIGTTGAGKGRLIILQTIWNIAKSQESMIVSDVKKELFLISAIFLKLIGYQIRLFNFTDLRKSDRWNVLHNVNHAIDNDDIDAALFHAKNIAQILCEKGKKATGDPLWYESAVATIQALILYVSAEATEDDQRHLGSVYALLLEKGQEDPDTGVSELEEIFNNLPLSHIAKKPFALKKLAGGNTASSINVSTAGYIQMFNSDTAIKLTSKQVFDFQEISDQPTAVFLQIPHSADSYNELAALFVEQSYSALINHADNMGGRLKRRVHYLLDEFGNLPKLPEFQKKQSISRSYGIIFNCVVQGIDQIKKLYRDDFTTIMTNFTNLIYLLSNDNETLEYISRRMGQYTRLVESASVSMKEGTKNQVSLSYSKQERPLMTAEELARIKEETAILIRLREYPSKIYCPDLTKYYANSDYGLAPATGNISYDKEKNRQILESRTYLFEEFSYEAEEINYFLGNTDINKFVDYDEIKIKDKELDNILNQADNLLQNEDIKQQEEHVDKNVQAEDQEQDEADDFSYNKILNNLIDTE